ncbi:MAG: superoxide dismutase [Bacilli bacterium]|nr:superoxide dismutase [Bacilli bacterium]
MFEALPLNYEYDALEPFIDRETMILHYDKHYMNYLNNLNKYLKEAGYKGTMTLPEIVQNIEIFPLNLRSRILFNAGGVLNHNLYFNQFSNKGNNIPTGSLKNKIDSQFGSYSNLIKILKDKANTLVGSGFVFLVLNKEGDLEIMNMSNQETPYMYGYKPILALDLWEHAYYLKYNNEKNKYVDALFEILDFDNIGEIYEEAKNPKTNIK